MRYGKTLDFSNELQNLFDIILTVEDKDIRDKLENSLSDLNKSIGIKSKQIRKAIELLETL